MRLRTLFVGAAAIVGVVAATSLVTACGTQAIGETASDAPDVTGNTGIDDSGATAYDDEAIGTQAMLGEVSITCPDGWVVTEQGDDSVIVKQDDGDGRIEIERDDSSGADDAQDDVDDTLDDLLDNDAESNGFDSENANEYVVGDIAWYGYEVEGGFSLETSAGDGVIISVVGQGITIEEAMDMLSGITMD